MNSKYCLKKVVDYNFNFSMFNEIKINQSILVSSRRKF